MESSYFEDRYWDNNEEIYKTMFKLFLKLWTGLKGLRLTSIMEWNEMVQDKIRRLLLFQWGRISLTK
jgi:hypothetical protein